MIYAHQHKVTCATIIVNSNTKNTSRATVTEKCALCDVMHHNVMLTANTVQFASVAVVTHFYKTFNYSFTSIQLILAGGRAPPALV
jgi:hypothetical protein